jgi:hypothetical protein
MMREAHSPRAFACVGSHRDLQVGVASIQHTKFYCAIIRKELLIIRGWANEPANSTLQRIVNSGYKSPRRSAQNGYLQVGVASIQRTKSY